ncbi:copper resistance CopC/CopD family protein [Marinicrinis lubricantis]|uniref:Copper resistance CopC/CopD family protein n=1 Tax=Marinicrinis lubricantis TaxID=2086470 RepID=A0ABW1IUP7_9BACL
MNKWFGCALAVLLMFMMTSHQAAAHASLIQAKPSQGERLDQAPTEIKLIFNERLEKALFSVTVLDPEGRKVTNQDAEMSQDQRELSLQLPELEHGVYTVSYQIMSADGHPVQGSYVFAVGEETPASDLGSKLGAQPSQTGSTDVLLYFARWLYFALFLLLIGWVIWRGLAPASQQWFGRPPFALQALFLASLLLLIVMQLIDLMNGWDQAQISAMAQTSAGWSWLIQLLLSLIGFLVLGRSRWLDGLWAASMIIAKSLYGHAMAIEPVYFTLPLNWIHLAGAAVWSGGLLLIVMNWRRAKEEMISFLPRFSGWALTSMIVLTLSGIGSTLLYVQRLEYLLKTDWGKLLLLKIGLAAAVVIVAGMLRFFMRRGAPAKSIGPLLKVDFALALMIACIVGIFTYLNPIPPNSPLYWHEMGEVVHTTVTISPSEPGDNRFALQVWLTDEERSVKNAQLRLRSLEQEDFAPIDVPLQLRPDAELPPDAEGYRFFQYESSGPYLPFAGKWEVEVRVMDSLDNEHVYKTEMEIY